MGEHTMADVKGITYPKKTGAGGLIGIGSQVMRESECTGTPITAGYLENTMKDQYPIMTHLKESRIVSFKPQEDGTFRVQEKCDRYFTEYLTRAEMLALAAELVSLVGNE